MEKIERKKKVLITGSSGMLGTDLCQELCGDYELFGMDIIQSSQSVFHSENFFKGDITDERSVYTAVSKARPEIVIHTAAWTDVDGCELNPDKAYRVNGTGTGNIARACQRADSILIYISTDFVFDGKKAKGYGEDDRTHPINVYGRSKLKGEEILKHILGKYLILRTSWLFGKNGRNFVDTILKKARLEARLKVVNDQIGSPTYTKDLAEAIHVLLHKMISDRPENEKEIFGIYHISNSGSVSWYDYAKKIFELKDIDKDLEPITSEELDRPARRPHYSILDTSKFIKLTGFEMRSWQGALKEYLSG